MINDIYSNGLQVVKVNPLPYSIDNNNILSMSITFNGYLNISTVSSNSIKLLDDSDNRFNENDLTCLNNIDSIDTIINYDGENKTISLSPVSYLKPNSKYIILVLPKIKDTEGRLCSQYFSVFYTNSKELKDPIDVIHPVKNSMLNKLDYVELKELDKDYTLIQLSKHNTFDTICLEREIKKVNTKLNLNLEEGSYYLRVKGKNTNWSVPTQFYINPLLNKNNLLQQLEANEFAEIIEPYKVKLIEISPGNNIGINTKRNLFAFIYKGKFDIDMIDIDNTIMYGTLIDSDDIGIVREHGLVDFDLETIYREDKDETYVIFTPHERGV